MTRLQTHGRHHYLILLLLLPSYVAAQDNFFGNSGEKFTPYTIIIIIIAIIFALTAFLSIILRNFSQGCFGLNVVPANPSLTADGCPSARGLKPEVINSLPTYFYSDVKKHRNGKVELECAVCLSEFLDVEALRLLPGCNHVFHPRCIDKWLSSHVTCPICRQNLESGPCLVKMQDEYSINLSVTHDGPDGSHHAIICRDHHEEEKETKKRNIVVGKFPRSHSTGHSLGDSERFTLMLPEGVVNNTVMNRSNSNDGGELLTSMFSPRIGYRCGWFSTSMPIMNSMSGSVPSTVSTGVVAGGSKKVVAPPVKTSERLWPI